ncbi:MAG: PBP1A family penicillin-binding protein [Spirochaetales bacterium]
MTFSARRNRVLTFLALFGLGSSAVMGLLLGLVMAANINIRNQISFGDFSPSLPSQVLDINGNLITEFFSDEKREIVSYNEVPKYLTNALLTREDQEFFTHNGFSLRGFSRALFQMLTGQLFSGGSTVTQQLAGKLYSDRSQITLTRKLEELWWAFQLESRFSKQEILEQYLNNMPFGHTTYGVESASQYFFRHSVREITVAESAILVIQLVRPGLYSPIRNPNSARKIQEEILADMVTRGFISQAQSDDSFNKYWSNYDYRRDSLSTAFFDRKDKAPFFSEYIRGLVEENLLGPHDIYRDGLTIHTTLDLSIQKVADEVMTKGIADTNSRYHSNTETRGNVVDTEISPLLDMLALGFNLPDFKASSTQYLRDAREYLNVQVSPTIDVAAKLFGLDLVQDAAVTAYQSVIDLSGKTQVEGALVTIDNSTGYIKAMVGGSQFDRLNQFNRAVQANIQPGSSFKPLFYSAAIDSHKYTPATMIMDAPTVFTYDDGTTYTPLNFKGEWKGPVLLRQALAHSMNVPAIQVLAGVGFDAAIDRAALLLGISDPVKIAQTFPRKYPLALGIISIAPIQMARAYAVFANQGRAVDPIALLYIQDRKGNIINNPALDALEVQKYKGSASQLISPQTAYIMTDLLKTTVSEGTLAGAVYGVNGLPMEMAGKTGTTQNWSDAWTVGYSPYMTTAIWLGFDKPGNSLGLENSGAVAAGPLWASFMKQVHANLAPLKFARPSTGLYSMNVDAETGLLPSGEPGEKVIGEIFLNGTGPTEVSNMANFRRLRNEALASNIQGALQEMSGSSGDLNTDLNLDLGLDTPAPESNSPQDLNLLD